MRPCGRLSTIWNRRSFPGSSGCSWPGSGSVGCAVTCGQLLLATVAGIGQAMDLWILNERLDRPDLEGLAEILTEMIRSAVGGKQAAQ